MGLKRRLSYDHLVQSRIKKLLFFLIITYLVLIARLFYIQVIRSPHYKHMGEDQTVRRLPLLAKRGTIFDRTGKKLAVSTDAFDVCARPDLIEDKAAVAAKLAPLIGWDQDRLLRKLTTRNEPTQLAYGVGVEIGAQIREDGIRGIEVTPTMKRIYPVGSLAVHIIGFTNVDGEGIEGLEKKYDKVLRGRDGYIVAQVDARGNVIPGSKRKRIEPIHGNDLVLTIDATLQNALEMALEKSYKDYSAVGASAIMMDPKTGEILALANMPTYRPDQVAESDAACRRNRAVTDLYEPGSTLKTITACAALEEKAIDLNDTFYCSGSMRIGRRTVECSLHRPFLNGHGTCNVTKILRYSCNMGAAGMGLRLGKKKLYEYEKAFGLCERPGSEMPGEMYGLLNRWQDWPEIQLANIAFGQGIAVTPLQLTKAYCAVANGGLLMRPYVVKEIRSPEGVTEENFSPHMIRRVISEETAGKVAEMLHGVVTGGTGKNAQVEGYRVAGKTGSAQKATGHGYVRGEVIASFIGFLPVSDPRIVILVAVDEPHGSHFGAVVAAPVFQQAASKAMWHMKIPPDELPEQSPPVAGETEKNDRLGKERSSPDRIRLGG